MRISDWSSDVCSSDLEPAEAASPPAASPAVVVEVPPVASNAAPPPALKLDRMLSAARDAARRNGETAALPSARATPPRPDRSEERRVGKECVRQRRYRWYA